LFFFYLKARILTIFYFCFTSKNPIPP